MAKTTVRGMKKRIWAGIVFGVWFILAGNYAESHLAQLEHAPDAEFLRHGGFMLLVYSAWLLQGIENLSPEVTAPIPRE